MKIFKIALLPFASALAACAGQLSDSSHVSSGESYPATDAENIIFLLQEPDREFIVIGLVESHGMGLTESKQKERSMNALKKEAASIGAEAVIVTFSKQEALSGFDGEPSGEETILSGKAIKYK